MAERSKNHIYGCRVTPPEPHVLVDGDIRLNADGSQSIWEAGEWVDVRRCDRLLDPAAAGTQTWERRIPGTDVPLQRLHLDIDDTGRAVIHEAVLGPLLLEGGWERTT